MLNIPHLAEKKMEKLKFIIAIPTFNRLFKLKAAINSILEQKFDGLELKILISNTFSTDGTYQYLEKLKKDSKVHNIQ